MQHCTKWCNPAIGAHHYTITAHDPIKFPYQVFILLDSCCKMQTLDYASKVGVAMQSERGDMRRGAKLVAIIAAVVLALGLCPAAAFANQITISPGLAAGKTLAVTSDAKTFAVQPEAECVAAVDGAEVVYTVKLGIKDGLYSAVRYPAHPLDAESAQVESPLSGGHLSLHMRIIGGGGFPDGAPLKMSFYHALAKRWIERTVTIDLNADTMAIRGPELDADALKAMIESLPVDPLDIKEEHRPAIEAMQVAYDALSAADRDVIDTEIYESSNPYSRMLESFVWALDSLKEVENGTNLPDGTYSNQATSKCSLGKSTSARKRMFDIQQVIVEDGKLYGIIEHETNSSDYVFVGGQGYKHTNTDEKVHSTYLIPIVLNESMHIIQFAKNPTEDTIGIAYELLVEMDEASAVPDGSQKDDPGTGEGDDPGKKDDGKQGDGGDDGDGDGDGKKDDGKNVDDDKDDDGAGSKSGYNPSGSGAAGLLAGLESSRNAGTQAASKTNASDKAKADGESGNKDSGAEKEKKKTDSAKKTDKDGSSEAADSDADSTAAAEKDVSEFALSAGSIVGILAALIVCGVLAFLFVFRRRERSPARKLVG